MSSTNRAQTPSVHDALLLRAAALPSAPLCDAYGKQGALPPTIRRLTGAGRLAGRARTARCEEGSIAAVFAAIEVAEPGDVLVIEGPGEWAYFGDLGGATAARRGVRGVIIDGFARDAAELATVGFPLFARGLTPRGARREAAGAVDVELALGSVRVRPGDLIVADDDGIVAIAAVDAEAVLARAERIVVDEAARWRALMASGC